jgi:hypothetical protein
MTQIEIFMTEAQRVRFGGSEAIAENSSALLGLK